MPTPTSNGPRTPDLSDAESHASFDNSRLAPRSRAGATNPAERTCLCDLSSGARIVTANAGDHPLVLQLLVQARQAALAEDFQSRLDEPGYRPSDRLIVRRSNAMLGHVHVASHIGWFEGQRVPLVKLEDFEVLPEYRESGYDLELLRASESIATAEGAVLALVSTDRPEWFQQQGWSLLRGQGHTRASASAVLAHLDAQELIRRPRRPSIQVRTWRHFELDQVRQVYDQTASALWGPLFRSEECWQWLIGRKAQDLVLLAVQRLKQNSVKDDGENADNNSGESHPTERIVGYAVVRGSCIVEMMTLPKFSAARVQLLARACREAMDRDHHGISLYTPAADRLHELLVTAGGAWIDERSSPGPRLLMRLLSPEKWAERCYPLWRRRARAAGLPRPLELGIDAGEAAHRFTLTRRSSRLEPVAELGSDRLICTRPAFESLLAGNLAIKAAAARGVLQFSRPELADCVAALFPPRIFWQSQLELMRL